MITIKRTLAAAAVGAAMAMSGMFMPASAAPAGGLAPLSVLPDAQFTDKGLTEIRKRGRGGWKRGGRRHSFRGGGHRRWSGRGHRRYGRRHRNRGIYIAPFLAAPFLYGGYNHYYGGGNSCYQECRYYHGPRYCKRYWRRYC